MRHGIEDIRSNSGVRREKGLLLGSCWGLDDKIVDINQSNAD